MKNTADNIPVSALAALAYATATYESAWRTDAATPSLVFDAATRKHVPTEASKVANEAMRTAYNLQTDALAALAGKVGEDTARAIHGALIMAAAQTLGERPAQHVNQRSVAETRKFIQSVVAGEAGV